MLLSLVGIHGLLLCRVRERTREIGIRMALGARRGRVLGAVAGPGPAPRAGARPRRGLGHGAAASWPGAVRDGPADPAALVAVAALPLLAFVVSLHPACRATRIDAAEVLRAG